MRAIGSGIALVVLAGVLLGLPSTGVASPPFSYPQCLDPPACKDTGWVGAGSSCASTTVQQSPIDFTRARTVNADYTVAVPPYAGFENHDNNVVFASQIAMTQKLGYVVAGNGTYIAAGYHLHTPNEHIIDSTGYRQYSEIHIKTIGASGEVVVFSILVDPKGTDNSGVIAPFVDQSIISLENAGGAVASSVNLTPLLELFTKNAFYAYVGSLTTPPCTGRVQFFVLKDAVSTNKTTWTTKWLPLLLRNGRPSPNARTPASTILPGTVVQSVTP